MKKMLSMAMLAACTLLALPASGQSKLRFGFEGGLNVTKASLSTDVFESSNRVGFFIGPKAKFTLPIIGLGVDVAALYDHRESKLESSSAGTETFRQENVIVPIDVRYTLGIGSLVGVYFAAGPQFGFNVGDDSFSWTDKSSYERTFQLKKSNFSFNLGGGITLSHLEVTARYNIPLSKTAEVTSVGNVANGVQEKFNSKSNTWQIGLAYYF